MSGRRIAALAGLAAMAVALVSLLVGLGGGEGYELRLRLSNAAGLREGSDVFMGGVRVGTVSSLDLGPRDEVIADLSIDPAHAPVGKDVSASIAPINLLGKKKVDLARGTAEDPAPSGFVVPPSRVKTSVDLDQVVGVLDADTRARLAILLNEGGAALAGRGRDLGRLLDELPPSLTQGRELLGRLVGDNRVLAHLVSESDQLVAELAAERKPLARMIAAVGDAATTVAARRVQLRDTLRRAPAALATLQRFLADLRATTVPLAPAARQIAASAPPLSATLAELAPFTQAAKPALARVTAVAPDLGRLGSEGAPVVRRALPVVTRLESTSRALVPVTDALDKSIDNVLAVVDNWARGAVGLRDGLSHVFRGGAAITAESVKSIVDRFLRLEARQGRASSRRRSAAARRQAGRERGPAPVSAEKGSEAHRGARLIDRLLDGSGIGAALGGDGSGNTRPSGTPGGGDDHRIPLLDFLLGP